MPLDPELQVVVDMVNSLEQVDPSQLGPESLRSSMEAMASMFGEARSDVTVDERSVTARSGPLPVRRYVPSGGGDGAALVWFHGGGWVIGSLDTHHVLCADLAAATGATVLSVDYRLAPEHRYPAAVEDAVDAVATVATGDADLGVDPTRIAVGGDSAGGHLATVVARRLRDLGGPPLCAQVLVYPVTDLLGNDSEHPSQASNAVGYVLTTSTMDFFVDQFVPDTARRGEPDASPLRAEDLSGLPPALVLTSEFDPLRDQGEAYARAMQLAGVDVTASRHDGTIHLFIQLSSTQACRRAIDQIGSFVAERV